MSLNASSSSSLLSFAIACFLFFLRQLAWSAVFPARL
jgi:hypothetical protein